MKEQSYNGIYATISSAGIIAGIIYCAVRKIDVIDSITMIFFGFFIITLLFHSVHGIATQEKDLNTI